MTELEIKIKEAQDAYYKDSKPIMSDMEFDELWDQLKREQPDSELLNAVGDDHIDGFKKVDHTMIMGSQNKANSVEEMDAWLLSNQKAIEMDGAIGQYKMDGISLELTYTDGKYTRAVTRGDGKTGDDITDNVAKMQGVVKQLKVPYTGTIRGEIVLSRANFMAYFADTYANCRNTASGISKRLDGSDCDKLNVVVYDAQYLDKSKTFGTQRALQNWLVEEGFEVAEYWCPEKTMTGAEALEYINEVFSKFDSLKYDIDGIVWKTNSIDMEDILNNYRPKTQIALKPARTYRTTEVVGIEWSLVNGTVTPIAILKPVDLLGAKISRASLSNIRKMEELGIEIGHTVTICRTGEIIPKVVKDETTGKFSAGYEF